MLPYAPGMDLSSTSPPSIAIEGPCSVGARVLARGRRWTVADVTRSIECAALRLQGIGHGRAQTLLTPFDRPVRINPDPRPRVVRPRRWLHELDRAVVELHPFGSLRAAGQAPIRLLPYQLEPALAVLRDGASRVLVADGVGLGKTIQAGIVLLELADRLEGARALVLAPAGLREQWLEELSARFGLDAVLADTAWLKSLSAERPAHVNPWSLPGIYVASHDLVKRPEVLRPLEDVTWDAVVIDEAHVATSGTDRRVALHAIAARAHHVMLLTATPPRGDPAELQALCRIGAHPDDNDAIVLFQRSRADVGEGRPRKTTVLTVVPSDAERRMHDLLNRYTARVWLEAGRRGDERARLVSIVLRKRALSSAASLAVSVERRLALLSDAHPDAWQMRLPLSALDEDPLEDDAPLAELSAPGLADPGLERRLLTALAGAAHSAARDERKARFLLRLIGRLEEPAIVFTEYRDTLARLEQRLAAGGHAVTVLHGGMGPSDRSRVQRAFNERGGILIATDAASEGLNLHHRCRVIVHYELAWNPSRLEQRAGRIDRLGQTRRVHELALVAAHTAERLVLAPLISRFRKTAARGGGLLGALTESRVAAAIMTNTEVERVLVGEPAEGPASAPGTPADLGPPAAHEAARLERHRRLAARSCRGAGPDAKSRAVVSTLECGMHVPHGLFLVFALTLVGVDGVPIHAEPRTVRVELDPRLFHEGRRPTTRRLQDIVSALAIPQDAVVLSLVHQGSRERLDAIALLEDRRRERRRRRAAAIVDAIGHASAAQQMVQAGLFDRRSLRAAALGATSAAARQDDANVRAARLADNTPPERKIELVAALLVRGGR